MKTYTDTHSGKRFIADLHQLPCGHLQFQFYELGKTDPVETVRVPKHLSSKAVTAYRRNDAGRLFTVAKQCIDVNTGFQEA